MTQRFASRQQSSAKPEPKSLALPRPPLAVQPKLAVNTPGDAFEQEADQVAESALRTPDGFRAAAAPGGLGDPGGGDTPVSDRLAAGIDRLKGGGQPLAPGERAFFEPRLGHDFSRVRIHADSQAAEMAQGLRAHAFTTGTHVVFAAGRYAPHTPAGRGLLAHELAHVVQQRGAGGLVQRQQAPTDLRSNRFHGNVELEDAFDGNATIQRGARGLHVTLLQQALVDAGFQLPVFGVDGRFEQETENAVKDFQRSQGLTGAAVHGRVDANTMNLLDQHFLGHRPEHAIATNPARPLTEGTRPLSATERTAVAQAITTQPQTPAGAPTFNRIIAAHTDPYEVRIANRLNQAITDLHASLVASRPARTPANLMSAADIDRLAQQAKTVTDTVFGRYRSGPPLAFGVNITDQFVERDTFIAAAPRNADWSANWRVMKLLDGDDVIKQINEQHGAINTRAAEWALIAGVTGFPNQPPGVLDYDANPPHVTTGIVGTRRAELLDIHRNWPASAGNGQIHLQRYLGANDHANRNIMYRTFSTIIHEYIHTLEHPQHVAHRTSLPQQQGSFTLREGMTDYLAKIVWDNLTFTPALRAAIEDRFQDPANPNGHPIPQPNRYDEWVNAERAVGIVGIRNAMAAFFLGRTDLIGGP